MKLRRTLSLLMAVPLCIALAACSRSHIIVVSLTNISPQPLSNVIVDYPEATFGKNALKPGETYQYRIKATETGPLKITFSNAAGESRSYPLGMLHKDDQGSIEIKLVQESGVPNVKLNVSR